MKKILCAVLALLVCFSAAGCRNSDDVLTQTQITEMSSIIDPEALESAAADHLAEKFPETENSNETTAVPADESEVTEHIDTAPSETYTSVSSETITVQSETDAEPVKVINSADISSGSFNAAFLKETAGTNDNFVISPLSVKLALNMAAAGAGENSATEREFLDVFGYRNPDEIISDSSRLISELDRDDGSITVNNSVWVSDNDDVKFSGNYIKMLGDIFKAEFFEKDLSAAEIVSEFNGWINKNTNGLIPKMISEPFNPDARMILVNALYFNNKWETEFPEHNSFEFIFRGVNGESRTMAMTVKNNFEYAEGNTFKGVVLPYEDGSKMKVYLPIDEYASLANIIENLSPAELSKELDLDYTMEKTVVCMPRFECDYSESLRDTITALGIDSAFDRNLADFSGMLDESSEYPVYIYDVIHAAKIKCGEKGTEAAAATTVIMAAGAAPEEDIPKEFVANRPFLYVIESPGGEVLFMGIISNF